MDGCVSTKGWRCRLVEGDVEASMGGDLPSRMPSFFAGAGGVALRTGGCLV